MSADRPHTLTTASFDASTEAFASPCRLDSSSLTPGTRVGHYVIRRLIGRGGMGASVYEAIQDSPQRLVALKVLPASAGPSTVERFCQEADALALVRHPNVVSVFESGTTTNTDVAAFMAMELIAGARPLDQFVAEGRPPLALRDRVKLMIDVCTAVGEMHRLGLVHRDLKFGNVLVDSSGAIKLVDFGITTVVNGEAFHSPLSAMPPRPHGTPAFMSPEQARAEDRTIDARSDVYSLGIMLCELLTGRPLRDFDSATSRSRSWVTTILEETRERPSNWNPALKGDVDRVVMKALEVDPRKRFESASAFGHALIALLNDEVVRSQGEGAVGATSRMLRRWLRTSPRSASLVVTCLGVLAGLVALSPSVFSTFGFTKLEPFLLSSASPVTSAAPLANIVIVPIDEAFDGDHLRRAMSGQGISPDPASRASMRRLHAKLIDRLVELDAKAIVFDLAFSRATEGDADLIAAAHRAVARGVPVIAVAVDWDIQTGTLPAFRDAFRFGGAQVEVGNAAWELDLAVRRGLEKWRPHCR